MNSDFVQRSPTRFLNANSVISKMQSRSFPEKNSQVHNHSPRYSLCVCVRARVGGRPSVSLLAFGNVYCRCAFGPAHGRPLMDYSCLGPDTGLARQQFQCNRPSVCVWGGVCVRVRACSFPVCVRSLENLW